jgi:hypothetical protein
MKRHRTISSRFASFALAVTFSLAAPSPAAAQNFLYPELEAWSATCTPTELLAKAGIEPLTFPKTSTTTREFQRQRFEHCQRTLIPAIDRELDGALKDPAKKAVVDRLLGWWVGHGPAALLFVPDAEALVKDLHALLAPTANAPILQALIGQYFSDVGLAEAGIARCRVTFEKLDPVKGPGVAGLAAASVLVSRRAVALDDPAVARKVVAYLQAALSAEQCPEADAPFLVAFLTYPRTVALMKPFAEQLLPFYAASKAPVWARQVLVGQCEVRLAWRARGDGFAGTVKAEGWRGFEQHMVKARDAFNEAWRLRPDRPEAAAMMIEVAMAEHAAKGETTRLWFDRSTAAQCDYLVAYQKLSFSLRPRWGGNPVKMAAFALACGLGHRPGSSVGEYFNTMMQEVITETNSSVWRGALQSKAFAGPFLETRQKLVAEADTERAKTTQNALLAFEAWLAGNFKLAAEALEKAGDFRDPATPLPPLCRDALRAFGKVDAAEFVQDCRMRGGRFGVEYAKITELRAARKLPEAAGLLAIVRKNPAAPEDFATLQTLTDFESQVDTKQWTKLPITRETWNAFAGNWQFASPELRAGATRGEQVIYFRGGPGGRYEVRGEIQMPRQRANSSFAFLFCNLAPQAPQSGNFTVLSADGKSTKFETSGNGSQQPIAQAETWVIPDTPIPFRIRRYDAAVSVWFGERLVLDRKEIAYGPGGPFSLGLTTTGGTADDRIIFRNLEARAIGKE